MAKPILSELQEELAELKAARSRVLRSQSYGHGSRSLTRVSYADIQRDIKDLERRIAMFDLGGAIAGSTPVFGGHRG